ncbi:MAG: Rne/Rng family ribonuclease [candidate division KSB1 bacterium]|nr:Rne/Rng family ribonuclease [candidate division KSB1 bacterium]MDZ7272730.1 Rne/Rng family ribonuclease [candidate division KSB1 bacterium]MDZ7284245.1 Rne/Rng family ribonuclease [candidate division KSB1 bacterium]MDZ7297356.1 Rne/Rng family ribonuclease [candidate division KSB1 bacterium]MDZ7307065.1 Rne/Rng family ribonuclease [candidate division KSB1 bacterium]
MRKEIFINSSVGETRIAILEDGKLVELLTERPENERMVGDIYLGRVVNVVKGMRAAFVDIGLEQDAFLHFSDIGETLSDYHAFLDLEETGGDTRPPERATPNHRPIPKEGQEILVQIIKEPISTKGCRITTELSIAGRYMVIVPNSDMVGVSKKVMNLKEKRRLKKIAQAIKPKGFGLIIRTVAEDKDEASLRADLENLMRTWRKTEARLKKEKPPCLVYKDLAMASSVIRDLFTPDITRVVVDSRRLHQQTVSYLQEVAPQFVEKVELYRGKKPLFDTYGIEQEIEKSLSRKIWTRSGGYILFDHAEALTAIDVNSGKFMGRGGHDENALKINLEAAREIARQLRLRDIGGIIVIDFIDMIDPRLKRRLHDEFRRELRKDRAQSNISQISEFGMIEMTRERVRPSLLFSYSDPCPTCEGTGRVISKATVLTRIERWLMRYKFIGSERSLVLVVHSEMQRFLTAGLRSRIRRLMWKYWMKIQVLPDDTLRPEEFKFLSKRDGREIMI